MSLDLPIARATTDDGKTLLLFADGMVTFGMGYAIPGIGASKDAEVTRANLAAGWWLISDACLYTSAEVSKALKAARKLARVELSATPGAFREAAERALKPAPKAPAKPRREAHDGRPGRFCVCSACLHSGTSRGRGF